MTIRTPKVVTLWSLKCWMLNVGCWILLRLREMLDVECWMLNATPIWWVNKNAVDYSICKRLKSLKGWHYYRKEDCDDNQNPEGGDIMREMLKVEC